MVISTTTTGIAGNKVNEYKIEEKKEVSITAGIDNIVRLCVDANVTGVNAKDKSWCEKFVNVTNDTFYEIRSNIELGGGTNALKKIFIHVRVATGYYDAYFVLFNGITEIGRTSQESNWILEYETDNYFDQNLNFKAFFLPSPTTNIVDVAVVWRNKI
ncbi:TPA_asm: hypothetical protein [Altiarchaeum virus]|nr:TPA_asm: hypothetical protein [Altiarchaeum virus]